MEPITISPSNSRQEHSCNLLTGKGQSNISTAREEIKKEKSVSFNIIPSVKILGDTSPNIQTDEVCNNNKQTKSQFKIFYSNISSLSPAAKNYLFHLPSDINALFLLELHSSSDVARNAFRRNGWSPCYNPTEFGPDRPVNGHGGEMIAFRSSDYFSSIPSPIIDIITAQFGKPRFSAAVISLNQVQVLTVTVYLWHTEGFSERNLSTLNQILLLKVLMKLPSYV